MREISFLKQNAEKWKKIESYLTGARLEPDALADYFVQLTDDLAYSRTFFPESKTTRYLNSLTAKIYQKIYRNKREEKGRVRHFFQVEYPLLVAKAHKELLVAFLIFVVAAAIGFFSTLKDDTYVRLILGDTYVNMTTENIENNDPMAVYKKTGSINMFLGITVNNIRVSFIAFAAGLALAFGSGFILFQNGIMLGAFQAFFYEKGLLTTALKTIWIHGALEITAIIVAGGAGLVMGKSLLFPGTYSRKAAFVRGARAGMKLAVGLTPVFIVAGFLEGFVTRHTGMPLALTLLIIFGSLAFVLFYLVVYPQYLTKKVAAEKSEIPSLINQKV